MFWSRRLIPRIAVLALLGLAFAAAAGDLALPDEHFMAGSEATGGNPADAHSAQDHDSSPSSDTHPEHTCHCVHAHGLALVTAPAGEFAVGAPVTAAFVQLAGMPAPGSVPPPFHPPKILS